MSLVKQLTILIILLFSILFAGTVLINVHNSQVYLQEQLASHARDAATSLGMSTTTALTEDDTILVETMVNSIFDSGYYRSVLVEDVNGNTLVQRELDVHIEKVPDWFISLFPLDTPEGSALIMTGWRKLGQVKVRSHPGYAHLELWRTSLQSSGMLFIVALITMLVSIWLLRKILKPLHEVEAQALAICNRKFPLQNKLPAARELRQVVDAMNHMVLKVQEWLQTEAALSQKLRDEAYLDAVTGLANRSYFDVQLSALMHEEQKKFQGSLFLIQLSNFSDYNLQQGYESGDELLRQVASQLRIVTQDIPNSLLFRLSGAEFAAIVEDTTFESAQAIAEQLSRTLAQQHWLGQVENRGVAHVGGVQHAGEADVTEFLSTADTALRTAQGKGDNEWHVIDEHELKEVVIHGVTDWKKILEDHLENRNLKLHFQPVVNVSDMHQLLHYETFVRLPSPEGEDIPAGQFLPIAERLGLIPAMDRLIVETLVSRLDSSKSSNTKYAVNLSLASLKSQEFLDWLFDFLSRNPLRARQLVIETTEGAAYSELKAITGIADRLHQLGSEFSLDHFGLGFNPFGYLVSLKPHYIKIHGSYIRDIETNPGNYFFVRSMTNIARTLEITVIADEVETENQRAKLQELALDGIQGYLTGRPAEMSRLP